MFNVITIPLVAIVIGIFLAFYVTRQPPPQPLDLVPPEDDYHKDLKTERALDFPDLFLLAERMCEKNGLCIKEKHVVSENESYWVVESENEFFFGKYLIGFFKTNEKERFVSMPTILEFKDFIKSVGSTKGFFFTTGYYTKDVFQPLEGPKVSLYNRRMVLEELSKFKLPLA